MKKQIPAQLLVLLAAVLWGTTGLAQSFAPNEAHPIAVGALRMLIGGSALFMYVLYKKQLHIKDLKILYILQAALSIAVYQPLFFSAVKLTGVAFGTVIAIGSAPIFSGLIESLTGKKTSKRWMLATLLSVVGCILLFVGQGSMSLNVGGAFMALGAGLAYAVYVKASAVLLETSSVLAVNGVVFFISGLCLMPTLLFLDLNWLNSVKSISVILHLGLITTALAYTIFAYALKRISSPEAVTLTLAEPLTAAILGITVLKEQLTLISVFGIVMMFTGLILTSNEKRQKTEIKTVNNTKIS